jgi:hypothetical protein
MLPIALGLAGLVGATTLVYDGSTEQMFNVMSTGYYTILAYGAEGGTGVNTTGGAGAEIGGTFFLTAGETLDIYVGGEGATGNVADDTGGGGGGGGTFVVLAGATPTLLVVAGGGGGGAWMDTNGLPGLTGTTGGNGTGSGAGAGGTGGLGGGGAMEADGGGGGGGYSSGGTNSGLDGGDGGSGYPTLTGGSAGSGYQGAGGFGGGGGGGEIGGGGGGGYSGGGGGTGNGADGGAGGGGGSYLDLIATDPIEFSGVTTPDGNGYVEIFEPEPGTFLMLGVGLLALAAVRAARA